MIDTTIETPDRFEYIPAMALEGIIEALRLHTDRAVIAEYAETTPQIIRIIDEFVDLKTGLKL